MKSRLLDDANDTTTSLQFFEKIAQGSLFLNRAAFDDLRDVAANSEIPRNQVAVLIEGWACRYRMLPNARRQIVDVLLPGDLIGMDAFLPTEATDAVVALTDARYGTFDHDSFQQMLSVPEVALYLLSAMAAERRRLDHHLAIIGQMLSEERVAALILEFHERLRRLQDIEGGTFQFALTQSQVADMLGITVVHVNRVLKKLREDRIAILRRRSITILDEAKLAAVASCRGMPDVDAGGQRMAH